MKPRTHSVKHFFESTERKHCPIASPKPQSPDVQYGYEESSEVIGIIDYSKRKQSPVNARPTLFRVF